MFFLFLFRAVIRKVILKARAIRRNMAVEAISRVCLLLLLLVSNGACEESTSSSFSVLTVFFVITISFPCICYAIRIRRTRRKKQKFRVEIPMIHYIRRGSEAEIRAPTKLPANQKLLFKKYSAMIRDV